MIEEYPLSSSALQRGEREGWLLELLACPDCREPLFEADAGLSCSGCGGKYAISEGIPQLLPTTLAADVAADQAWRAWAGALDRLVAWRRRTWDGGAGAQVLQQAVRGIQGEFAAHCRLADARGTILDVGCGSSDIVAVLTPGCRYVGVDPVPLPAAGRPPMVRGVGERLPFRASSFDLVLALETLDHCQSPAVTVAEILRVLKPEGTLCVEQYVTAPGWPQRLACWRRGSWTPGRRAPADSSKMTLLDASGLLALLRPAFADVEVAQATQGSHLFVTARGKQDRGVKG